MSDDFFQNAIKAAPFVERLEARKLLLGLSSVVDDTGRFYARRSELRGPCGLSYQQLARAEGFLERIGFLFRDYRPGFGTEYRLNAVKLRLVADAAGLQL